MTASHRISTRYRTWWCTTTHSSRTAPPSVR